jgi:hypothetical protein
MLNRELNLKEIDCPANSQDNRRDAVLDEEKTPKTMIQESQTLREKLISVFIF